MSDAIGAEITRVDTTPMYPLGFKQTEPAINGGSTGSATVPPRKNTGEKQWIYVYNDSGSDFAQGDVIARKLGETKYHGAKAPVDTARQRVIGVAQHAIANGKYGFILRDGIGKVTADTGGVTVDRPIIVGNAVAGCADTTAAVTTDDAKSFGVCLETVAATALFNARLHCTG